VIDGSNGRCISPVVCLDYRLTSHLNGAKVCWIVTAKLGQTEPDSSYSMTLKTPLDILRRQICVL